MKPRSAATTLKQTTLLSFEATATAPPPNVLARLSDSTRQAVLSLGRQHDHAAGDLLFRQGDPHDGVFLIDDGMVRSYYLSEEGREMTLGFWTAGHYVGAPQMFGGGQHAWTSAAVIPTRCLWLPGKGLRALSLAHADLAVTLIDALVHKSQCYCALLQLLATQSMQVRLARLLAMLAARDPAGVVALSHGQLASMIGSTRQWVSLTLTRFAQDALIHKREDGALQVMEPARLAALR